MSSFRLERDGSVTAHLDVAEIALIAELGTQLTELLTGRPDDDPALRRLLPDAYPDDADASAEFRRFTADGLIERKLAGTSALLASIGSATPARASAADTMATLHLDPPTVQAWLRSIGDLRLTIATRLGIERDGDEGSPGDPMADLYDWLGYLQGSLVDALDAGESGQPGGTG